MKFGPTLKVYAVTPPEPAPEAAATKPASPKPYLYPSLAPLGSILPDGTYVPVGARALSGIDLSKFAALDLLKVSKLGDPPSVTVHPNVSAHKIGFWRQVKGARSVVATGVGSYSFLHMTQGVTHAQVVQGLGQVPILQQHAESVANTVLQAFHSHGGHALLIAVPTGTAASELAKLLGYKKYAAAIGIVAGALIFIPFFLAKEPSPYVGKWNMNAIESSYQQGIPPRQAMDEIKEEKDGLFLSHVEIEEDGKRENVASHLMPDGREYPTGVPGEVVATTQKANTLTSTYSRNGKTVETDTRVLSSDQKSMTVTAVRVEPSGQTVKDVTVYERQ